MHPLREFGRKSISIVKHEIRQPDTRRRRLTDQGFPGAAGCRCGPHLPLSAQSGTICPLRRASCATNGRPTCVCDDLADAAITANRMTERWTSHVRPVMPAAGSPMGLSRLRFAGRGWRWRVAAFIRPRNDAYFPQRALQRTCPAKAPHRTMSRLRPPSLRCPAPVRSHDWP